MWLSLEDNARPTIHSSQRCKVEIEHAKKATANSALGSPWLLALSRNCFWLMCHVFGSGPRGASKESAFDGPSFRVLGSPMLNRAVCLDRLCAKQYQKFERKKNKGTKSVENILYYVVGKRARG